MHTGVNADQYSQEFQKGSYWMSAVYVYVCMKKLARLGGSGGLENCYKNEMF